MLKHGRAGVPMEVMGLMLGEYIDEWTTQVVDVFAMPQSGTTVTVESVDHVFQMSMVEMLKQTGRYARNCSIGPFGLDTDDACMYVDRRWWWVGTTHILGSGAGCPALISTLSRSASRATPCLRTL